MSDDDNRTQVPGKRVQRQGYVSVRNHGEPLTHPVADNWCEIQPGEISGLRPGGNKISPSVCGGKLTLGVIHATTERGPEDQVIRSTGLTNLTEDKLKAGAQAESVDRSRTLLYQSHVTRFCSSRIHIPTGSEQVPECHWSRLRN